MRIAVLSQKPQLRSTQRLLEAAKERGHDGIVVDYLQTHMNIASGQPSLDYVGQPLTDIDAIIPRVSASCTFYGCAVVRQLEMMGVFTPSSSQAIARSRDKLRSLQILAREGIPLPTTTFCHTSQDIGGLIDGVGGAPLIIKLLEGTQGIGVVLCETRQAAQSVIEAFRNLQANMLVQEYIEEAKGQDLRCFVVGDQVVASMLRTAAEGEFRSNLHRGGSGEAAELTRRERSVAVRAAKAMKLGIAGVDILRGPKGPLVIEVNSSPGLEGIERTTGVDVAGKVIEWIEQNAHRKKRQDA